MPGEGIIILVIIFSLLVFLSTVISRNIGGSGGIVISAVGTILCLIICIVLFYIPQHSPDEGLLPEPGKILHPKVK
mgnify:CR=1 FL=1